MTDRISFVVLGAGLAGATAALRLAQQGHRVTVIDRMPRPLLGASRHNEGKLHLGYVYAADPVGLTRRMMAEGSLQFLRLLEDLTGFSQDAHLVSEGFRYVVPDTTMMTVEALWAHVETVDADVRALCKRFGAPELARSRRLGVSECAGVYSDRVQAAFQTPEIAVDPARVSDLVSACLLAHPNIAFIGGAEVLDADRAGNGDYRVTLREGDDTRSVRAPCVINALWEDRTRIDAMLGIETPFKWMQRWKATLTIDVPQGAVELPSTTGFVGPYGDFVLYGGERIYLSWYSALCLSRSTEATPEETRALVETFDKEALRREALAGMAEIMPGVAALDRFAAQTKIGGGFIMAVGESDIDDPDSVLHQRHQIGVEARDGWISISTGKFCTAPQFGVAAAEAAMRKVSA